MYRLAEITNSLLHLVGWQQSYDPAKAINKELTETESGLYFQGAHPLLTLNNVSSIMPDDFLFRYVSWNLVVQYKVGDKVSHNNQIYIARVDNLGEEPAISDFNDDFNEDFGNPWEVYNYLSDYLEIETRNGIAKAIQEFATIKKLDKETRDLFTRTPLFEGLGRLAATVPNRGKLVGFEIKNKRSMGITTKIERIGLQMTGGVGSVRVYLFHSNVSEPIKTADLNYNLTNAGMAWFQVKDWFLPCASAKTGIGGYWYVAYNQNDLPGFMQGIDFTKDWSREPCGSCNKGDIYVYRELDKYIDISPFKTTAPADFKDYALMWNVENNTYPNASNFGLNLELTVGCDITDFIISQRSIFADVVQKQVAATMLRTLVMNPNSRVNRNQTNIDRKDVLYELDGNTMAEREGGLGYELKKSYKALNLNTEGIDRYCLSCNNHGVRFKTIG